MSKDTSGSTQAKELPVIAGWKREALDWLKKYTRKYVLPKYQGTADRFCKNGKSRKDAINLKCLECCCGQISEVRHCPIVGCALWTVRPYQQAEANEEALVNFRMRPGNPK